MRILAFVRPYQRADLIAYYRLLYVAAIPALVLLSGAIEETRRVLSRRARSYPGRASYSIYLRQQLINEPNFNGLDAFSLLALHVRLLAFCVVLHENPETPLIEKGHALPRDLRTRLDAPPLVPALDISNETTRERGYRPAVFERMSPSEKP